MKNLIVKILPYAFGVALGLLLLHPPQWLKDLGAVGYLLQGALAAVTLLAFIGLLLLRALPENVAMTPLPPAPSPDMDRIGEELASLGFSPVGPAYEVAVSPPARLQAWVHDGQPAYATVFRTGTVPAKVGFDFVSILEGWTGGLTSVNDPAGAALPAAPGSMRQVIRSATPGALFQQHCRALAWVAEQGLRWRRPTAGDFVADFQKAMNRERAAFLRSPLTYPAVALWRVVTRLSPHLGPLEQQRHAAETLDSIRAGATLEGQAPRIG